ncbi:neuroendocrine protein 7B2 [Cephus cinctus]|uniref:Neuroendocrine protein 7B2 n=1 Tax=Cephus cinctus TaxID=211228 RepID=A0AAJ7BIK0_CEPCN|nr:neuroendocrine protein 7B2 [Cephus cinctus]
MICAIVILGTIAMVHGTVYMPPMKEHFFTDMLFRELVDRMGNELVDAADSYLELQDGSRVTNEYEKAKEIPAELPMDYDGIDTPNPNPSIRDQEYLQHSSLWSHQRLQNGEISNDRHRIQPGGLKGIKDEKTESNLPAYCTPPNPCPIGYTSENHCIVNFENTATFSRDFQSAQDCMCDTEHMVDCSNGIENNNALSNMHISNSDFDQIVEQFQEENPFFRGEKLPIAAKKGINVGY